MKLTKIKLNTLAENNLRNREMNVLRGGNSCTDGPNEPNNIGSDTAPEETSSTNSGCSYSTNA
jgi:natural product precursor